MSTRQNKKRKARNSMNRERTVTTLAEDPNTTFLVPTPSEDPPKSAVSVPSPFTGQGQNSGFQMVPPNFSGYPNNYMPSMPPPVGTPFQYYPQQQQNVQLPPGKNDLEILEKLKDMIKNNQHDVFKPIPNPAALASIYMGPRTGTTSVSQVPPHPEQIPTDLVGTPVMSHSNGAAGNVATRPRSESWDKKPSAQTPVSATSSINNVLEVQVAMSLWIADVFVCI
ncbi:hypothetical protein GLOTRDRAFT_37771 [Gloeophyllum trabeum ATCC 11539]|uniref:Uncharacterized protein n=1 Tax=Gloeophyllum trabeum (strain ATCC 11539 / FP-39264 / Madison 617) TaxID=670483 RepID=S7RUJ9_GLOTA|nr:uncharacterized protein GLOTRDRAFT_37771 [Gloeophyllum trabeum ATCC 11539]EPQ56879.1 hypothetical protein GLOTRDRAFT_37771 [Gloeophyllum trabeum ATCC 11539]